MSEEDRKPIYTMSIIPDSNQFGMFGLILFVISLMLIFLLFISYNYDVWLFFLLCMLWAIGGYCGRMFESNHHKSVMKHMPDDFKKLYKDVEYALARHEQDEAKTAWENRVKKTHNMEDE